MKTCLAALFCKGRTSFQKNSAHVNVSTKRKGSTVEILKLACNILVALEAQA